MTNHMNFVLVMTQGKLDDTGLQKVNKHKSHFHDRQKSKTKMTTLQIWELSEFYAWKLRTNFYQPNLYCCRLGEREEEV